MPSTDKEGEEGVFVTTDYVDCVFLGRVLFNKYYISFETKKRILNDIKGYVVTFYPVDRTFMSNPTLFIIFSVSVTIVSIFLVVTVQRYRDKK